MSVTRPLFLIGLHVLLAAVPVGTAAGKVGAELSVSNLETAQVFEGTVTLVDTNRHLVVLQDADRPMAIKLDAITQPPCVGDRIAIEGRVSPYFTAFPDYPDRPSGREIVDSFEGPTDWKYYYLTRMRGFLRPPADGQYTFWIAADDEAELWLSSNQEAAKAKKIAFAPRATFPREWKRYPEQKSEPVFLKAGENYYIEAIQRQWRGHDCLAVAWQGPDIKQGVIEGRYLSPKQDIYDGVTNGILREYWTNFFVTSLAAFFSDHHGQPATSISEPRLKVLGTNDLPQAELIHIGETWPDSHNFQWVEVGGTAAFMANNNGNLTMELADADARMTVRVFNWGTNSIESLANKGVRVCGVCESVNNAKGQPVAGIVWVPDARQISPLDFTDTDWRALSPVSTYDLASSNPNLAWGRKVLVRGAILKADPQSGDLLIQGDDSFCGYISDDGTNWSQVGVPVSMAMGNSVCVGLAVSSAAGLPLPVATFDQVGRISKTSRGVSIGSSDLNGGVQYSNSTYTIPAGSGSIDGLADKCSFIFEPMNGEGEMVARIKTF